MVVRWNHRKYLIIEISYLTECKQRFKINHQFSSQRSILRYWNQSPSFNVFLCDRFIFCNGIDFTIYADHNTPYCIEKTPEGVISQ